jgi:triosephosphate isomerase
MEQKRNRMVAGNWKMNNTYLEGRDLAKAIVNKLQPTSTKVVLGTPYIHLKGVHNLINGISNLYLAAQNCHEEESGAYTGEVSASMLRSTGASYVILGHSERREYFRESNDLLAKKVNRAMQHDLKPIFCCGENLEIRKKGEHQKWVEKQLKEGLFHLSSENFEKVVIAYEPIWAIGTGETASPEQAQEMHHSIRQLIADKYGDALANKTMILYGGSVKPSNAKELFGQPDVDGGLIGGASLKADDFVQIIESF